MRTSHHLVDGGRGAANAVEYVDPAPLCVGLVRVPIDPQGGYEDQRVWT